MNESEKMLEIIHKNCKKEQEKMRLKKEVNEKKKKRFFKLKAILLIILFIAIVVSFISYNEKEVKNCMDSGNSENFCRYAGE